MPQFQIDLGPDYDRFNVLDSFTQGYVEAIFWLADEELDTPTFSDLAQSALDSIVEDCRAFQEANRAELIEACDNGRINGYDDHRAGVDYWLTRNGHGAGFWDRGLGDVGDKLADAARLDGSRDMYEGDDGKLYLS